MMESFFDTFFAISLSSFNLFSFMMGMMFAFFNQGLFGKRIGKYLFIYLLGLVAVYGFKYYMVKENNGQQVSAVQSVQPFQSIFVPVPR